MSIQPQAEFPQTAILRRSDGSIAIEAYARRAAALREEARAETFVLIAAAARRALRLPARPAQRTVSFT